MNIKDMTNKQRNEYRKKYNDESGKTAKEKSEWRKKRKKAWQERTDSAVPASKSNLSNKPKNVTDPYGFNKTKNSSDKLYGTNNFPKKNSVYTKKGSSTTVFAGTDKTTDKTKNEKPTGIARTSNVKSNSYNAKKDKEIKNKVFQITGVDLNKKPQVKIPINKTAKTDPVSGLSRKKYDKNEDGIVTAAEKKNIDNKKNKTMEDVIADRIIEKRKRYGTPIDTSSEDKVLSAVKTKNKDFTRDEAEQLYTRLKAENSSDSEVKREMNKKTSTLHYKGQEIESERKEKIRKTNWEVYNERNYNKLSNSGKKVFEKLQNKNIPDNRNALEEELKKQGFDEYDRKNLIDYATGNYVKGTSLAQETEKHPVIMSAVSVGQNLVGGLPATAEIAAENIHNLFDKKGYDKAVKNGNYNFKRNEAFQYLNSAQYIRSKVAEKLSTSTNSDILNGTLSFLYQAGMSTADNLANRGLSGGSEALSLGLMGTNAGASRIAQGLEDGEDITSATIKGIAAGAIEIFTEKMGYDALKIFQNSGKAGFVNYAKDIIKEAIPEGFEEGTSDILNTTFEYLYDNMKAATNGDFSGLSKMPEYDLKEILLDAAAGAISGVTLSVGSTFARAQNTKITGLQLLDAGKQNLVFETAEENGIKTDTAKKKVKEFVKYCDSVVENDLADDNKVLRKYTKLESNLAKEVGSLNNILQENLNDTALKVYNEALENPDIAVDLFGEKMEDKTKTPDSVFTDLVAKNYKSSKSGENGTDSNAEVSGNKSNAVTNDNENTKTAPFNVLSDNRLTPSAFIDYAKNGGEQLPQVQNQNAENLQAQNGENVATDRSAVSSDVFTRLIGNKQSGYTTKMQADINEHSEDTHYVDNYKSLARVDENGKVEVNGNTYTADEYSAEYNRIYDMGLDEETPTSEIKSKIFNAEQVRQIYAAAMVDDNTARYDGNMDYEQTLSELEENEAIDRFGNKTLANIMTATQNDIKQVSDKLGLNVEFCDELPKHLNAPNGANGAYDGKTDTIYILNSDPHKMRTVFIHEVTHWLETTKGYSEFKTAVFKSKAFKKWLNTPTDVKQARYNSLEEYRKTKQRNYGDKGNEYIDQEIIATFVGDNIFSKDMSGLVDFVNEYKGSQRKGIIGFIKSIFEKFKKAIKGIDKLENKFLSLVNEKVNGEVKQNKNTTKNGSVKFEINPKFTSIIDSWYNDNRPDNESFVLGSTGDVLQGLGARENDIYISSRKINTILKEHPEMSIEVIKKIPEILENPILVLASKNKTKNNTRLVMFGRVTAKNGKPALGVLDLIPREKKLVLNDMQKAVSTYTKTNSEEDIKSFFEKSEVLYTSKNKKITANLISRVGFSVPTEFRHSGYMGSITYSKRNVNIKGKPFNEVFSYDTNNSISKNAKDDTKFSVDDEVEQTKDLIAIHNVREDKLLEALNLGGLPSPSVAIMRDNALGGNSDFGDISLVFRSDTINPETNNANKVYSSDAYTPVSAKAEYKLNSEVAGNLYSKINKLTQEKYAYKLNPVNFHPDNLTDSVNKLGGSKALIEKYKNDYGMKQAFLADTAEPVKEVLTKEQKTTISNDDKEVFDYLRDNIKSTLEEIDNTELIGPKMWVDKYDKKVKQALENYYKGLIPGISKDGIENIFNNSEFKTAFQRRVFVRKALKYYKNGATEIKKITDYSATEKLIDSKINQKEYEKWLNDLFGKIVEKKGVYNGKDYYTDEGDIRSFEETHWDYTLDNIVRAMNEQDAQGGNFLVKNIFGGSATKYNSLDEIRNDKQRLKTVNQEDLDAEKDRLNDKFLEISQEMTKGTDADLFSVTDVIVDGIAKSKTKNEFSRYLKKELNGWAHYDEKAFNELCDLIQEIRKLPTEYFEAKPQRAVSFDEVAYAVIPDNSSDELKTRLEENGIKYIEYKKDDKKSRIDALNNDNSVKFAINDEFVGPNGDYVGFDEDTDEVTYLSAEDYQKELNKNPRKAVLDKKQIELRAKSLLNDFQSRADSTEVANELSRIFNKLKNSPGEWESVYPQVQDLAQNIYDNIAEQVTTGEVYDGIKETLKGSAMIWDDEVKNAFSSDWNNFIRANRAKLNLLRANSNKGGIGIDVQYDILSRQFPGYFSGEANGPKAQLEEILDVLNSQQYVYDTFNSDNESEIINDISSEIMSAYTQIDKIGSKTDKAKAQNEVRFGADTYFDEDGNGIDEKRYKQDMRKQVNSTAADYIKEQKALFELGELSASGFAQRITDKLAATSLNAKLKPLETYYKQKEKYRQRLEKVNRDISKNYGELKARAENPTEEKYIPKELVGLVDNVIKMIEKPNFDAVAYLEQCKTALKNAQLDSDTRALYKDAVKNIEDQIAAQGNLGTAFDEIANRYSKLGDDKTGEQSFYCYHETVAKKLQDVAEILKGTDVRNLNLRQNEALSEGLKCLTTFVKDSCKAIGLEKAASAYEVADRMVTETKNAGKHQNIIAKGINMELSPERMFRRLGGYAQNSAWEQMATMLTDGQTDAEFIKQRLKDKIAPALKGENFKSAQAERSYKEKDLVDIGLIDENNNVVKIPRSFMLSAYMHLQAEANRNHALGGGFTVPDFRKYYKGKQQQSFDEGTRVKFNNIKDSLEKMQTLLTDYEKTMLATTSEFFNKHTKAEYNKISEEVFGFERAKVKKYFPIYSNKDFVASEFDVSFNSSLENQGNMKARQQYATNPIMLFDIYDVINRETERCGEYCGKLKAEITFKRVYNTTMAGYDTSIKEQVGKHFGESGKKYIEHLMQDYSGTRKTESSVALSKLRSAVATGALMGNINVAMKQAGSYPTAAATIGWKPLLKALATNDNGAVVFYRANREIIDKYTPWLRARTEGYSTQEIADLKNAGIFNSDKTKWLFGWITASDVATVGRLWQASEYYIRDIKPELEQGTDEYYKEVAKIYNKVIFDTQPNYTVMQRPDILRNPNSLLKSMIMFSTQPLQNLGILYDAQANLNAQRKAFKAGTVDENTVKQAKREVAKGISSIVVSGITITAMTLLAKCITGKMDDYKDEYGNINLESILKGSAGVFNSTMAGMVTFGSDVYNLVSSLVSDKKYYGISVSSIDIVSDAIESLINLVNSDSNTIIDNGKKFVEKTALMFGFPARNLKNLVNGIYNKITTDDWFAIESSKKPSQRYGEIYEAILSGDGDRYKEAYKNAIDSGVSVNQIENGIKNILMADRQDDIIEAATAQNENDTKVYNDVVDDLVEAGFDENIVIGAIDTMVEKLNNDGLTDEQKKTKEKAKSDYMTELLKGVNYNGMNAKQKADAQNLIKNVAEEKAHEKVTKEAKNKKLQEAIKFDNASVVNLVDYIAAEVFTNAKYADKNNDGKVDIEEKINAINNADINNNAKTILKGRALLGSKKIDTDNDGAKDTKFSDLSPEKQEEYILDHSSDIDTMLEDKKNNAKKSEKKAEYRKALENKVDVFDYSQDKRKEVQKQIDSIASAQAGEDVDGDWEAKTVNNFIDFDNSGFIDISDYVKFKVYSKGYTKKAEQFEVINQLPGVDKKTKQKLKLYVAVRSKKFDADGDGKKEKYFTKFSSAWQEKYIINNVGSIISNSKDWR